VLLELRDLAVLQRPEMADLRVERLPRSFVLAGVASLYGNPVASVVE
jgi:hypothetical protein